jgi:hypothetical protein
MIDTSLSVVTSLAEAKYAKDVVRSNVPKPDISKIENNKLSNIVNELYRD